MQLAEVPIGSHVTVETVGGERSFRRRLMELGLVPGTAVVVVGVAPLGDPLELLVRGASLSIRRAEASEVRVIVVEQEDLVEAGLLDGCGDSPVAPGSARSS